jgi:hypothetical protein
MLSLGMRAAPTLPLARIVRDDFRIPHLLRKQKSILANVPQNRSNSGEYSMKTTLKPIPTPEAGTVLRLVLLGDTHELHREVEVPDGDILIHVGDFTMFSKNMTAVADVNTWLGELPHHRKILGPGNHIHGLRDLQYRSDNLCERRGAWK